MNFDRNHQSGWGWSANDYVIQPKGSHTNTYSFKAKLGQDISTLWPSAGSNVYDFMGWQKNGQGTRYVTKQLIMNTDLLPSNGTIQNWYANWNDAYTFTVNYYLQNADDDGYTRSAAYSQTYNSDTYGLTPKVINGYTFDHGNNTERVFTYNLYYNRNTYKIDYYYGSSKLDTISNVKFDANINKAPYVWTPTQAQCNVDSDYTWGGWYSDSKLTTPYTFSTMPASNLVLYAKWNPPTFTVTFDMDGGTPAVESQTITKNGKVEKPADPTKVGYTFDGWYDEDGEHFDWQKQITADTTIYAHWTQDPLSYTVHYVDEQGNKLADDRVVIDPNAEVGDKATEKAVTIPGYRPDAGSKEVTHKLGNNEITFVYSERNATTSYTVKYLIEGTDIPVADEKHVSLSGNTLSVIELPAAVDYTALYEAHPNLEGEKYYPVEADQELVLGADESQNVLTFYYYKFKSTKVTVNYVDMDGNPIDGINPVQRTLKVGETFTLNRAAIPGWELNKAVVGSEYSGDKAVTSYKITEDGNLVFTLFYQKKVTITAEWRK